jgi:hypothetical protein
MRHLVVIGALAALMGSTSAFGQVTGIVSSRTASTSFSDISPNGQQPDSAMNFGGGNPFNDSANYQVSADVTPTDIRFADNATAQGDGQYAITSTTVTVTYTNNGTTSVTPTLQSVIEPGGFGFYEDDLTRNPTFTGNGTGDLNQTPQSATATFNSYNGYNSPAATAGFSFQILSGDTPVLSLSDSVTLTLGAGPGGFTVTEAGAPHLRGFSLVTPAGSNQAVGYQWDTTILDVPLGVTLAPGESSSLTYITTATATADVVDSSCGVMTCPQILSYAGFGDPIGKPGGGGGAADPYFPILNLSLPTFDLSSGVIGGLDIVGV